jgi:beta-lactamase superfamily II metal-dependent hydrolase
MSIIKSFAVGHGDTFYIDHNSDNLTIIDCCVDESNRKEIVSEIREKAKASGITRFISTHPDDDHIRGLVYLDEQINIVNFYVVDNAATKPDQSDDFDHYCELRDSTKAFKISQGCSRRWMSQEGNDDNGNHRGSSGINILWPKVENPDYKEALQDAAAGLAFNNMSAIIKYHLNNGAVVLWMGDMETCFMEAIEDEVDWPKVDVLFAPHHGRESGAIPTSILD